MDWTDSTLGGVIAGFVLSLIGTWALDTRRNRREAGAVRAMLRLELARNLRALERFWESIPPYVEPQKGGEDEEDFHFDIWTVRHYRAEAFVQNPLPRWSRTAWEGQTAAIPGALTSEEIERLDGFYSALDEVIAIRDTLARAASADEAERRGIRRDSHAGTFNEQIGKCWPRLERAVTDALDGGRLGLA